MASQNLTVLLGQIRNNIGLFERELVTGGLGSFPFLTVLRNKLSKLLDVVGELCVGGIAQVTVIDGAAEVFETSGLRQAVKLGRDWARGQEAEEGSFVHFDTVYA